MIFIIFMCRDPHSPTCSQQLGGLLSKTIKSLGEGILGVAAAVPAVLLTALAVSSLPLIFYRPFLDRVKFFLTNKQFCKTRISLLSSQKPLFIEKESSKRFAIIGLPGSGKSIFVAKGS